MAAPVYPLIPPEHWAHVPPRGPVPAYDAYTQPIEKSQQDDREYRVIRLQNGLHAMLVHDPKADKAAASMNVSVGHLSDPDDMPGLAHFCEHLLFMGTEQFPRENEYSEYLAKNNGSSNAYTSTTNTNYYFSVATPALPGALARFAAFFSAPLFAPSCTARELLAVDSEHKKNHQSDVWRVFQLNKHLSADAHVWRKFGSGNRDTLTRAGREASANATPANPAAADSDATPANPAAAHSDADGGPAGRETRRRLVDWWSKEYCAGRMNLCVIGKEPLDALADTVSTLFSPVPHRAQDPRPLFTLHPFGPRERGTLVSVHTVMAFHALELSFPLPWQPPAHAHKPAALLGHFVGHEGVGSLHAALKARGWASGLSAGPQALARGFAMFKVTVQLTRDGFLHHREVMLAVFKYLALLRAAAPLPAWHQQEAAALAALRLRFAERRRADDYAVWVAEHMDWPVPPAAVLAAPQLVRAWDADGRAAREFRALLEGVRARAGRAVLMARAEEHAALPGAARAPWDAEPVYGTRYRVAGLDGDFIREADGPNDMPDLVLPAPNEFIPADLDVDRRDVAEPQRRPHLVRATPRASLWYKRDDQFWVPKAQLVIEIRSPAANASPQAAVLTQLFAELAGDALATYVYPAALAGLSHALAAHPVGVSATLAGYSDRVPALARAVLARARALRVRADRLRAAQELLRRAWENFEFGQSYAVADYWARHLGAAGEWTVREKLAVVDAVTVEDVERHIEALFAEVHIRMLVTGNMRKEDAIRIAETVEEIVGGAPLPASAVRERALVLPEPCNFVFRTPAPNPAQRNSALAYLLDLGRAADARARVAAALLAQVLAEPAFAVLRTREQLGYVVACTPHAPPGGAARAGLRVVVQSERPPAHLEARVERFLAEMQGVLARMGDAEFAEHKAGLARRWSEAAKNMNEEASRFWAHIDAGDLDFLRREKNVEALQHVTKADVLDLFLAKVHPASPHRAKLSVHLHAQAPPPAAPAPEQQRVSAAAAAAIEALVRGAGFAVAPGAWRAALGGADAPPPRAADLARFWAGAIGTGAAARALLGQIPEILRAHPVEGEEAQVEEEEGLGEGVVLIEDVRAFKAGLEVAEEPEAVEWGDLPASKL